MDYAIKTGLVKLGLEQEQTHIRILQRDCQTVFGHKDAVVSIIYDEEESQRSLEHKYNREFTSKFCFRFHDNEAQVHVPACFYDTNYLENKQARIDYLRQYIENREVPEPDVEMIERIAENIECQYDFCPVKQLETSPLNDHGASIHVVKSEDNMLCRALIFHGEGITEDEVFAVLKKEKVIKGILRKNLQDALNSRCGAYFNIARGLEAVDDSTGQIDKFFQEDEHKEFAKMIELLTIDTRQVKDINIAERNQLLMRIGDIIEGRDGYTIDGTSLKKSDITDSVAGIKFGQNVQLSEDGKEVYAKQAGHIRWDPEEQLIDVEPLYVVDGSVDYNEGNIVDFVGKVLIKGDVLPKFRVSAEGDIEVQGSVEDAHIKSNNGNVLVAGSIINNSEGKVEATKTVHCSIASNAKIHAGKIIVEKEVMNSELEADKEVEVIGSPGVIIGGEVSAKELVRANTIGSENWVPTKIHVGDVGDLKTRLRVLRQKLASRAEKLNEAKEISAILQQRNKDARLSEGQQAQLDRADADIPSLEEALQYGFEEEGQLKEEIDKRKPARLEVLKELFPQVDVYIYEGHMVPQMQEKHTGFRCRDGVLKRYSL